MTYSQEEAIVEALGSGRTPLASADDQQLVRAAVGYLFGSSDALPSKPATSHQRGVLTGALTTLEQRGTVCTSGRQKRFDELSALLL